MPFPKNFFFGAATSAHQVEGGNYNDWTEWERKNAKRQMLNAKLRKWPEHILEKYPNPLEEENYISGLASDHYNRFREDFDLLKEIGLNAYRFSIEWSRIEPEEGRFDEKEIEHYREVIKALRDREIEPFVTLWHWTLPLWFSKKGGWTCSDAPRYFSRFCEYVGRELTDVHYWITLNEPSAWNAQAYLLGMYPPGKRNFFTMARVYFHFLNAHKAAYRILKSQKKNYQVGISESVEWYDFPLLRQLLHYFRNTFFIKRIRADMDFIGINYYKTIGFSRHRIVSDLGWKTDPEALYWILQAFSKYKKPIFITENGVADARDVLRPDFIKDHLLWVHKAIEEKVDVRGYFHWSLLDNFEWDSGFWPRFGLIEVDYKTQKRKFRDSALVYKDIISGNKKQDL